MDVDHYSGVFTRGEHSRCMADHSILPLLGEVWDLPNKNAIICGCRHLPHLPLHLYNGQVSETYSPLQLTDLQHCNGYTRLFIWKASFESSVRLKLVLSDFCCKMLTNIKRNILWNCLFNCNCTKLWSNDFQYICFLWNKSLCHLRNPRWKNSMGIYGAIAIQFPLRVIGTATKSWKSQQDTFCYLVGEDFNLVLIQSMLAVVGLHRGARALHVSVKDTDNVLQCDDF